MLACRPFACPGSSVCEHDEGRGQGPRQVSRRGSGASVLAPRRPCLYPWWLVVAVLLLAVPLVQSKTVSVTSIPQEGTVTLAAALADPQVTRAELLSDVALEEVSWGHQVLVNRSVTITPAPGVSAVLDLNFLRGKVVLGAAARVIINGVILRNTRKTPGFGIEIFSGSNSPANSTRHAEVWLVDLLRIRLFCPSSNITMASLSSYPRPDGYGSGGQDNELVPHTCYRDECFEESVRSQDFVTTVQPLDSEDTAYLSPYVMVQRNVTRACKFRVADTCVQQLGTDECVLGALDSYIRKKQQSGRDSGANPAAIAAAVGTAAGASCVIAALVLWLWRRRRAARAAAAVAAKVADLEAPPSSVQGADGLGSAGLKHSSNNSRGYVCLSSPLLGVVCGKSSATWQVVAVQSAAEFQGKAMPNEVKLGVLQGAGSFGRVYAGEWAGMHVAVKVLQHTGASSNPVLNEVHLMLSFSHPNVVKGYHYICWGRGCDKEGVKPADSASSVQAAQGHAAAAAAGGEGPVSSSSAVANSQGVLVTTGQAPWSDTQPLGQLHPVGRDQATSPEQQWCPPEAADGAAMEYHPMTSSSNCSHTPTALERPQQRSGSCRVDDMMEAWLIQEYCDEGTLLEATDQWRAAGPEEFMRRLLVRLREVASGMGYLHSRNVVHGDLKGNNILLCKSTTGPYGVSAKVSDFGLSRALETGASFWQTQTVGTVTHAAPEQLKTGKLTPAGDVYAFGILMWELYTGHTAYGGLPVAEVIQRVALQDERPPVPEDMPEDYRLLMRSCWSSNPGDRPSFASVLRCIQLMLDTLIEGLPVEAFGGLEGSPLVADL